MARSLATVLLCCTACLNPVNMGGIDGGGSGGSGGAGGSCPASCVPVSPATLDFGAVPVGQSATETLTLTNCGAQSEQLALSGATGPDASDFSVQGTGTIDLAPCQSAAIHVTFTPSGGGAESASIAFSPCSGCSPQVVSMSGGASCGFGGPTVYAVGGRPVSVAVADFNADGRPDVAAADFASSPATVSVLLNAGGGTFQAQTTYAVGSSPTAVAAADLDGDGLPDLAVASGDGSVSVLLGQSLGGFLPRTAYPAGKSPDALAIGDVNGDGRPDLVIANAGDGTVAVLLNVGHGTFGAPTPYSVGLAPDGVAIADFNGDGRLDLAVTNGGSEVSTAGTGVNVLLNQGGGSFAPAVQYAAGVDPQAVAVGDFDGDGKPDLAVVSSFATFATLSVFLNQGNGTFAPQVSYDATDSPVGGLAVAVAVGDFNGDGLLDIAAANQAPNDTDSTVGVFLNQGQGTFATEVFHPVGHGPNSVAVADLDGNGSPDFAVADEWEGAVGVLLNGCPRGGNGATIACTPNPIDFGAAPAGSSPSMVVTCTNTGTESLTVVGLGTFSGSSVFALSGLPSLPLTLSPSQSFSFAVAYNVSLGSQAESDALIVNWTVADPSIPVRQYTDPIMGVAGGASCRLAITPAQLVFTGVPAGTSAAQAIQLNDIGPAPCHVSSVALGAASDPAFALASGQPTSFQIASGASAQIGVTFSPMPNSPSVSTGSVTFTSDDPSNATGAVPLSGSLQ